MPYFLMGIIASALFELSTTLPIVQKIIKRRFLNLVVLFLITFLFPLAKGGTIPFAHRLAKKGLPIYTVLFILTAAPIINLFTLSNTLTALGPGELVLARFGFAILLSIFIALLFWSVSRSGSVPEVIYESPRFDKNFRFWPVFLNELLADCFEWLPWFICGCLLAALLRTFLPLSLWMNTAQNTPVQIMTAMVYSMTLSISSTVDVFVVLNWLGKFPMAVVLAFLLSGSIVDVRGIIMMIKGFGFKTTFYWSAFVLVMTLIGCLSFQYFING